MTLSLKTDLKFQQQEQQGQQQEDDFDYLSKMPRWQLKKGIDSRSLTFLVYVFTFTFIYFLKI